jgi:hypothetical protein
LPTRIVDYVNEQPSAKDSDRIEALEELRAISAISEGDYRRETISTPEEPSTNQAAALRRLSFVRRFLRRER